jgi:hypothetical protein
MFTTNKTTEEYIRYIIKYFTSTLTFTLRLLAAVNRVHRDPFLRLKKVTMLKIEHLIHVGFTLTDVY